MNTVLDVLKLRRVRLDYVSPPICPPILSGSGSSVFVEAVLTPVSPTGLRFQGECERFLTWDNYSDLLCMSLYQVVDPGNLTGPATLISECLPANRVRVFSPGWWAYTITDQTGVEGPQSSPVKVDGTHAEELIIPREAGFVSYTLYKNPISTDPTALYYPVLTSTRWGAFEVIGESNCYRIQAVTDDGVSELSAPACRDQLTGCCPAIECPVGMHWDPIQCSCLMGNFTDVLGPADPFCVGQPYSGTFTAVGGSSPFTWAHVGGILPPGLIFHAGTTVGNVITIDGTPTTPGNFSFQISCTTEGTTIVRTIALASTTLDQYPTLPAAHTDTAYSTQLTVSGGVTPYSFVLTSGSLPSGLTLSASGLLSGTPAFTGVYGFEITVTDSEGTICVSTVTLDVENCPVVSTYPTVDPAGRAVNTMLFGAFDESRRTWWIPENGYAGPNNQHVWTFDTQAIAWGSDATDPLGLINTAAKGRVYNGEGDCLVDMVYDQFIIASTLGFFSFYDLATKQAEAVYDSFAATGNTSFLYTHQRQYDPVRGYYYASSQNGGAMNVFTIDCNPTVRSIIGFNQSLGFTDYTPHVAYIPEVNRLYYGGGASGTALYHVWDASADTFTLNITPSGAAPRASRCRRFVNVDGLPALAGYAVSSLLMVGTTAGIYFIRPHLTDPHQDLVLSFWAGNFEDLCTDVATNNCSGLLYQGMRFSNTYYWHVANLAAGPTTVGVAGAVNGTFAFDPSSNRLFRANYNNSVISTYL